MTGFMAKTGNVAPESDMPSTAHSEHTLMDRRGRGMSPNMKTPNPNDAVTVSRQIATIVNAPQ